ncbi:Auxin-responsive protein SAUR71 [Ananas comosus]|nr:Auxin-responsive protein SAUR71 [Ananas comosus]
MGSSSSNKERLGKKRNLIRAAVERCRSFGGRRKAPESPSTGSGRRWRFRHSVGHRVAPGGCVPVCVGPRQERFLIRIECVNHPLFRTLLEGAGDPENAAAGGPLELPCDVDAFRRVMWEMEQEEDHDEGFGKLASPRSSFSRACYSKYQLLSPPRSIVVGKKW